MMRKSLISILFGLVAGFALRESSRRGSGQTATPVPGRMGSSAELMRRIAGLENALGDLQLGLERRLAAMDDHPAQAEARQAARPVPAARLKAELKRFIERAPAARLDYVEFFDTDTLVAAPNVTRGTHMALAVYIGKTRLIDNARL